MKPPAIEIVQLVKRFGRDCAVNDLSMTVPQGSIFGLVGKNGAGKTTTMSIIAGILKATSGSVSILGLGPFNPVHHKGLLTLLPQDAILPGHLKVWDALFYLGLLQGLTKAQAHRSTEEVLSWVGLIDRKNKRIKTLSHGMIRRLDVAQAFLGDPQIVLLDEPTSGLDPMQVVQIRNLIISRRNLQTIIISSHILSEIEAACDHVAFMDNGKLMRQGSMDSMTGQRKIFSYRIEPGAIPLDDIRQQFPNVTIQISKDQTLLVLSFEENILAPSDINKTVISQLMKNEIGILEIQIGSNLENEFLKQV